MGNHAAMVTLYFMHYNLGRVHQTLRMRAMTRTWPEDWDARKQWTGCWFCGNQLGEPFYVGSVGEAHLERHAIARGPPLGAEACRSVRVRQADPPSYGRRKDHPVTAQEERQENQCYP